MGKIYIEERAIELAHYIIDSKDTVRGAAKKFGISKSTVHMEVTIRNGIEEDNVDNEESLIRGVLIKTAANNKLKKPIVRLGMVIK